ncbi:MAG: hypothetical protein OHK0029_27700 [Armatimonadaceae bacterium]
MSDEFASRSADSTRIELTGETPVDDAIEQVLGDQPRAEFWRELRTALYARLKDAIAQRETVPPDSPERAALEERIAELRQQVAALAQEEAITEFVEDAVKATLARPPWRFGDDEDFEDDGYGSA